MISTLARRRRGRPSLADPSPAPDALCLDTALTAFAERGFEGVSVRDIAGACGVSHSLLNAKFGSKQGLWAAAVDHGMGGLHRRMTAAPTRLPAGAGVEQRLRAACIDFLGAVADCPAIVQLMNVEGARASARLDYIVETYFCRLDWPITALLREGRASGVFRDVPVTIAFTLLAHGAGALVALRPLIEAVNGQLKATPATLDQTVEMAADMIVRGLLA